MVTSEKNHSNEACEKPPKTQVIATIESPSNREVESFVERASWGNKLEFILSMLGLSVGLGCVWRFPYMCYNNGGGAFLIPYILCLIIIGMPFTFLELSLGQFPSRSVLALWSLSPAFKGIGYAMTFVNCCLALYYNVIISWSLHFLFSSMTHQLPWSHCNNPWNDEFCIELKNIKNFTNASVSVNESTILMKDMQTPSEQYFYKHVLQLSAGIENTGGINWQLSLCLLLAWTVVFVVLIKGVSSLGKVVYLSILLPYILLTVNFVKGLTLDGAVGGIIFYLKPDFSKLTKAKTWIDACTQIIFSMSIGTGSLHNMGSFTSFQNNTLKDSIMVPILTALTGLFAGFPVFSILGFMAKQKDVSVEDVASGGPGLMFVTFPESISTMPLPPVWSCLFFFMITLLGFNSQFSIVESIISSLMDDFPSLRSSAKTMILFRGVACLMFYLLGLTMVTQSGFYIFSLVDGFIGSFSIMITAFVEVVVIMTVYGYSNLSRDVEMMIGRKPPTFYKISYWILAPVFFTAILVFFSVQYEKPSLFSGKYVYPLYAELLGWSLVIISVSIIIYNFFYVLFKNGFSSFIKKSLKPSKAWRPALQKHRIGQYKDKADDISTTSSDIEIKIQEKIQKNNKK